MAAGSYLRKTSRQSRHAIQQSRVWRLRNSLMRQQGLSKAVAKVLAYEAVRAAKR